MPKEKIFPTLIIILFAVASIPYFGSGDWRRGLYFICGSVINLTVTW